MAVSDPSASPIRLAVCAAVAAASLVVVFIGAAAGVVAKGATGGLGTAVVKTFLNSGAAAVFGAAHSWQGEAIPEGVGLK